MTEKWRYERLNDEGKIEYAPMNDYDGKVTGHIVFGVKAWFDEHPEERKFMDGLSAVMPMSVRALMVLATLADQNSYPRLLELVSKMLAASPRPLSSSPVDAHSTSPVAASMKCAP